MADKVKVKNGRTVNMTDGPILSTVLRFCIPLILGGLLQCTYSAADLMVVGKFASADELAAVGATTPVTGLTINLFIALSVGSSILLARAFGAKDEVKIRRLVSTSYTFSLLLGVFIALLGQALAVPLLNLSGCPAEIMDGAVLYLRIIFLGAPAQLFYNFMCNVIRSDGDSKRPLFYLAVSGLLNVALNLVFVLAFEMGAGGVAAATVASQYASAALLFIRLVRLDGAKHLFPFKFNINLKQLGRILRLGVPSAVSSSMYSIANFQIMSAINAYGAYATAGNAAATNIESFFTTMTATLTTATSAFVGQNIGAGNRERVSKSITTLYLFSIPFFGLIGLLAPLFGKELLSLYLSEGASDAVEFGMVRLWCVSAFLFLSAAMSINAGALQAFGYTTYSMLISLICVCGFRTLWLMLVYPHFMTPLGLYICFTVSWVITCAVGTTTVCVLQKRFRKGTLRIG